MSGNSNVGNSAVYEAGDQRTYKDSELQQAKDEARFHEGKPNSHLAQDSKDERSIANKLAREEKREHEPEPMSEEARAAQIDATLPAKLHGNEPSKGAKIDQELKDEEEEYLRRKGKQ
ncbi:hypothetical protein GRF29_154g21689 [Pseudopithomyces chartarum]|uniref:Uncharacterized protein n=1 Tax=Pseudopithomyces chartarum TaxID=1892770 RepID=A0AAN6LSP7_9PLEO|nr:hypothetical protein GRF29_154g21689 [Pseudopithomyces chartarum]